MYKYAEWTGNAARAEAARPQPFGVNVRDPRIDRVEVWATEFKDTGPDYCEFRCFDADGNRLGTYRLAGY